MLHGVVVVVHEGGIEVYDLAGTNASKSCCEQLRKGGVAVTLHTSPSHCNQKILYILLCGRCCDTCNTQPGSGLSHPSLKILPCQGGSVGPCLKG